MKFTDERINNAANVFPIVPKKLRYADKGTALWKRKQLDFKEQCEAYSSRFEVQKIKDFYVITEVGSFDSFIRYV